MLVDIDAMPDRFYKGATATFIRYDIESKYIHIRWHDKGSSGIGWLASRFKLATKKTKEILNIIGFREFVELYSDYDIKIIDKVGKKAINKVVL